MKTGRQLKGPS